MQPCAPIANVGRSQVFPGRQKVLHSHRQDGSHGNLKWVSVKVQAVTASPAARMEVNAVGSHPDAVRKDLRMCRKTKGFPRLHTHMVLRNGRDGLNAAGLPEIGCLRQPVGRSHGIRTQI